MKLLLWLCLGCTLTYGFEFNAESNVTHVVNSRRCLVFEDHFHRLDLKNWQQAADSHPPVFDGDVGDSWEFQWYTNNRSNSFVQDGILYLMPTFTDDLGNVAVNDGSKVSDPSSACTDCQLQKPIQSASLRTVNSMSLRYGKILVRARLPRGNWLWPSIWMLPKYEAYGGWPASGEIDIMESRGNDKRSYGPGDNTVISSRLHWGPNPSLNNFNLTSAEVQAFNGSFADDFHTFGLEWSEEGLHTTVDNQTILRVDFDQPFWDRGRFPAWSMNPWTAGAIAAPFDEEFYLIVNLAVGGASPYWPDDAAKPWLNNDSHAIHAFWEAKDQWLPTWAEGNKRAFAIDWVKIWSNECEP
ncbi:concanavalin A-like lectin/glucanase [Hesseltinella vesiculosa]|uniref:Concanavalin A-like lectin/glucanase n=1 Tax=Hesseltinella vesiculosa TaxID=101127 RepID=A0A1X2GQ66_9FUNG|nr:concanavalin A-like lectin/glucanase [Hesseltinella vesiculosa]